MIAALLSAIAFTPFFVGIDRGFQEGQRLFGNACYHGVALRFVWLPPDSRQEAYANGTNGRCIVRWNIANLDHYRGADICMFAAHEWGHLTGYRPKHPYVDSEGRVDPVHENDPRNLMYPSPPLHPRRGLCKP